MFYSEYCHPILFRNYHKDFIFRAVGRGSGSRHCTSMPPGITNLYFGPRSHPTLAQISATVGPGMVCHHDNYRRHWNPLLLASLTGVINSLSNRLHHVSRWTNPVLEHFCCKGSNKIGRTNVNMDLCRTTIITFSNSSKFLGFCNTAHVDQKDKYNLRVQKELNTYHEGMVCSQTKQFMKSNLDVGIGRPTTCAYQFLNYGGNDRDGEVFQFFFV